MLDFCAEHGIGAEIEVIPADQINEACERVLASDVRYRFVIDAQHAVRRGPGPGRVTPRDRTPPHVRAARRAAGVRRAAGADGVRGRQRPPQRPPLHRHRQRGARRVAGPAGDPAELAGAGPRVLLRRAPPRLPRRAADGRPDVGPGPAPRPLRARRPRTGVHARRLARAAQLRDGGGLPAHRHEDPQYSRPGPTTSPPRSTTASPTTPPCRGSRTCPGRSRCGSCHPRSTHTLEFGP